MQLAIRLNYWARLGAQNSGTLPELWLARLLFMFITKLLAREKPKVMSIIKTIIYIVLGAVAGFVFTWLSAGKPLAETGNDEIVQSLVTGELFGFG